MCRTTGGEVGNDTKVPNTNVHHIRNGIASLVSGLLLVLRSRLRLRLVNFTIFSLQQV